jgi:hypothetical protein
MVYWGVDVRIPVFLTSLLVLGEWSALPPGKEPQAPNG